MSTKKQYQKRVPHKFWTSKDGIFCAYLRILLKFQIPINTTIYFLSLKFLHYSHHVLYGYTFALTAVEDDQNLTKLDNETSCFIAFLKRKV